MENLAERLKLSPDEVAFGIHRIVNARMADGVRVATIRRGVDPRRLTLLAFGGAAGLHVCAVAGELGIGKVVIPAQASVLSAWGMLNTNPRVELVRSEGGRIEASRLACLLAELEAEGRAKLGWFAGQILVHASADMRYGEQVHEISVPLSASAWESAPSGAQMLEQAFHDRHEALFTYSQREQEVVLVNARVSVSGQLRNLPPPSAISNRELVPPSSHRRAFLNGWHTVPVYAFSRLGAGQNIRGPAIIESDMTTILLREANNATYDGRGWLDVEIGVAAPTDV
jgi:N-methylhydantoinase A